MKKILFPIAILAGGAAFGYFLASFLGDFSDRFEISKAQKIGLLLSLIPMYILVIGWHELGHILFGRWQNFSFRRFIIGPFLWSGNEEGKISFQWNKSFNLAGGAALMMPRSEENLAQRFRWFAAGGPIASIVLGGIGFALPQVFSFSDFGVVLLFFIGLFSFAIAIVTLIPSRIGGMASDGMRILTLSKNSPTAQADIMLLRAMVLSETEGSTATLPLDQLQNLAKEETVPGAMRAAMGYFAYAQLLAQSEIDQAEEQLQELMTFVPDLLKGTKETYYLEQCLFYALSRRDLEKASAAYANFEETPFTDAIDIRLAKSALAELKGDRATAIELLEGLEDLRPKSLVKGGWALQNERRALIQAGLI